jgi:hypothetical protein
LSSVAWAKCPQASYPSDPQLFTGAPGSPTGRRLARIELKSCTAPTSVELPVASVSAPSAAPARSEWNGDGSGWVPPRRWHYVADRLPLAVRTQVLCSPLDANVRRDAVLLAPQPLALRPAHLLHHAEAEARLVCAPNETHSNVQRRVVTPPFTCECPPARNCAPPRSATGVRTISIRVRALTFRPSLVLRVLECAAYARGRHGAPRRCRAAAPGKYQI